MKENLFKIPLLFFISIAMVFCLAPRADFAKGAPAGDGMQEIAAQAGEDEDSFAPEKGYKMKVRNTYATHLDLRDTGRITHVKMQSPYGTCWGFGAISAAESSIINDGLATADELDLSEKQIAWFVTKEIGDKDSPQYGEGMKFGEPISDSDRYNVGGATVLATALFAQGTGPSYESTSPFFEYRGLNGEKTNGRVTWLDDEGVTHSGVRTTSYSDEDDWQIPEIGRFVQDFRIRESYILPSPGTSGTPEEKTKPIKEQLNQGRAVAIAYEADEYLPDQHQNINEYISEFGAQYTYEDDPPNHVVTIVGYDDNFPVDKFIEGHQPQGPGAWLVKNSWGSDTLDFPYNGYRHFGVREGQDAVPFDDAQPTSYKRTGYFWMSYYDLSASDPEAYKFEKVDPDKNYIIDQHDFMPVQDYEEYSTEAENKMANVFVAGKNQLLTDVSYFTAKPGTRVKYSVYILRDNFKSPEDGSLVYQSSDWEEHPFGGYHKLAIPQSNRPAISKGQKYSIVVQQKTPSEKYSMSFPESPSAGLMRGNRYFDSVINTNESFFYIDGGWRDLSDKSLRTMLKGDEEWMNIDNFSIKGYSEEYGKSGTYISVKIKNYYNPNEVEVIPEGSMDLSITIRGEGVESDLPEIKWTPSDPELFEVEVKNDGFAGTVTGKKFGNGYLTIDAGEYGKKIVPVIVRKNEIVSATLPEGSEETVYNGKPYTPKPERVLGEAPNDEPSAVLKEGQDYEIFFKDNVKCGKGSLYLEGRGNYEGKFVGSYLEPLSFIILPAKAKISKVTTGEKQLKVEFQSQKDSGISGYVLSYNEVGSKTVKTMKLKPGDTSAIIKGLVIGKKYEVSLQAYVSATVEDDDTQEDVLKDFFGKSSDKVTSGKVTDGNVKAVTFGKLKLRQGKVKKNSITVKWNKLKGAKGYVVYGCRSGKKFKKLATVGAGKNVWTYKKLKKAKYYKFKVVAYRLSGKAKKTMATAKNVFIATSGGKIGNPVKATVKVKAVTIKKGKSLKIKGGFAKPKKKKVNKHAAIRYESSKTSIATVSSKGVVKGKKKGNCIVYVYAQNGFYKRVKVTVK